MGFRDILRRAFEYKPQASSSDEDAMISVHPPGSLAYLENHLHDKIAGEILRWHPQVDIASFNVDDLLIGRLSDLQARVEKYKPSPAEWARIQRSGANFAEPTLEKVRDIMAQEVIRFCQSMREQINVLPEGDREEIRQVKEKAESILDKQPPQRSL